MSFGDDDLRALDPPTSEAGDADNLRGAAALLLNYVELLNETGGALNDANDAQRAAAWLDRYAGDVLLAALTREAQQRGEYGAVTLGEVAALPPAPSDHPHGAALGAIKREHDYIAQATRESEASWQQPATARRRDMARLEASYSALLAGPVYAAREASPLYCRECGQLASYVQPLVSPEGGRHFMCFGDHQWTATLPLAAPVRDAAGTGTDGVTDEDVKRALDAYWAAAPIGMVTPASVRVILEADRARAGARP